MSNKLIKKRRLNTKNHRIYLKDRELKKTTFEIGNKVSYIINKKTKTLQIIPQVVPFKTGDITVCKCKQKENDILPVMDIRRKEVLNSFNNCDIVQVLIYKDRVVVKGIDTTVDKVKIEKVSMTYKELDNLYREILKDDYDLYKKNKDYISEVGNRKIINKMEQFTDKFLRTVSLFCGAGLLDTGFKQAGFKIDFAIDFNKAAIDTYKFNNGDYAVYADINDLDINTLPKVPVLIAGSPCFPAGSLVMTSNGYKKIEDITINDYVLTHTNSFKKVYKTMVNKSDNLYEINTQCSNSFLATGNHPFYVRKKIKIDGKRTFKEAEWKQLSELNKDYYISVPINTNSKLPKWNGILNESTLKNMNDLNDKFNNPNFWYLVGRFFGDGWTQIYEVKKENKTVYRTIICCAFEELEELEEKLNGIFKYNVTKQNTTYRLQFTNKELTLYFKQFGNGALNKHLTSDILDLPVEYLKAFLNGYRDSDGCLIDNTYKFTTTSKELAFGIGQCIAKAYNKPFSIYKDKRPSTCVIEGRTVNQHDTYDIRYKINAKTHGFYEDNMIWMPIRNIQKVNNKTINVYNFEVEDDHSYTVNNIAVHNCQDFSNLNSKTGKVLDSPKNQLVRKVIDVAKANPELKVLVLENVPQLLTKGKVFVDELKERLSDFEVTINKVNSYDYGSPQVRRRAIIIASKIGKIKLVNPPNVKHQTVRDAFNGLTDDIPNQLDYTHSAKSTIEKMKYVPQGGNYKDIPPEIRSKGRYSNSYRRLDNNKPSVTIPHASRSVITHPTLNRIISIRECCRLFDLPDDYVIQGPLSEMYQIVGNGVPVKLAKGIAEQIKKAFVRFYWKAFNDFCLI